MSALVESSLNHLFSQAFKRKENAVAYLSSGMQHLIFPLLSLNTCHYHKGNLMVWAIVQ